MCTGDQGGEDVSVMTLEVFATFFQGESWVSLFIQMVATDAFKKQEKIKQS